MSELDVSMYDCAPSVAAVSLGMSVYISCDSYILKYVWTFRAFSGVTPRFVPRLYSRLPVFIQFLSEVRRSRYQCLCLEVN